MVLSNSEESAKLKRSCLNTTTIVLILSNLKNQLYEGSGKKSIEEFNQKTYTSILPRGKLSILLYVHSVIHFYRNHCSIY